MIPLVAPPGQQTKPLGMAMCQNRRAVPAWSYAMELLEPRRIIELSTYTGGLTIALGLHAYHIGCRVISYDRMAAPYATWRPLGDFLGIDFRQRNDIYEPSVLEEIRDLIRAPGLTFVLCDGGDKIREVRELAAACKPGDVIAAHDFECGRIHGCGGEIREGDVADVVAANHLERFMPEVFDEAAWLTYRRRDA